MLFNSFQFGFFFIVCLLGLGLLRGTARKVFLLAASYYFYMCWRAPWILLVIGLTLVDYCAGRLIERTPRGAARRAWLGASLAANLGMLGVLRYGNFVAGGLQSVMGHLALPISPPVLHVILPLGISFHTFQAVSYTIEVYRGKVPAERNLLNYALYVAFFPQMVAGPIERPDRLLPQFHSTPAASAEAIHSGLVLVLWGLFKKMVVADSLASLTELVFNNPHAFNGTELLAATVAFGIQIYCDFSGYSEIAVGIARVMGYDLTMNFRQPYLARSMADFWHRWHISLSTWFRDYLYIPMGGNRVRVPRQGINLLTTFVVSGLWHGANLTFVAWGCLHGFYVVTGKATAELRGHWRQRAGLEAYPRLVAGVQVGCTFALTTLAWVFFRANSLRDAAWILRHLWPGSAFRASIWMTVMPRANVPVVLAMTLGVFVVDWWLEHPARRPGAWERREVRWAAYYAVIFAIIFFGVFGHVDFIYFQF